LHLSYEQLERIESHAPRDQAAKAEAHKPLLTKHEFFTLDSKHDRVIRSLASGG
jgi:hypothetical protein